MRLCLALAFALSGALAGMPAARAADPAAPAGALCYNAIDQAQRSLLIPNGLLGAIGRVESGVADSVQHRVVPWPWTIDVGGAGQFFASKQQAIEAVASLQAQGVRSIDVGCMQVNLEQHPAAFANLDQAFDPGANALYAGHFLRQLFTRTASWSVAAGAYHSSTPERGDPYRRRVLGEWGVPGGAGAQGAGVSAPATPYGAFAPPQAVYAAFAPSRVVYGAFAPAQTVYAAFAGPADMAQSPSAANRARRGSAPLRANSRAKSVPSRSMW